MSIINRVTYSINATSKSSSSERLANAELVNCTVAMGLTPNIVMVFGEITNENATIIEKYFEVYDDIRDSTELSLLEV